MFKELLKKAKEKGGDIDPNYKKAKMGVLQEIHDMASADDAEGIKGLKKVTVASNDTDGLAAGLEKAKGMVEGSPAEEKTESPEDEAKEDAKDGDEDSMSEEEIDELMQMLQAKKAKLQK